VLSRSRLFAILQAATEGIAEYRQPEYLLVDSTKSHADLRLLLASFPFPAIVKTDVACGSSASHQMAVVHSIDDAIDWMKRFAFGETLFVLQVGRCVYAL